MEINEEYQRRGFQKQSSIERGERGRHKRIWFQDVEEVMAALPEVFKKTTGKPEINGIKTLGKYKRQNIVKKNN